MRTPGIAFYSVQKGERSQELRQLPPDCTVHDLDALIRDYGDGETSLWYPSMRLFRQTRRGDWAGVMARVVEALEQL